MESNTTVWRDERVVPDNYENLPQLVAAARKARGRTVTFDWRFSRDDLQRLRRAVYEWGSGSSGRYRAFDARVLAVVNEALDDRNSALALSPSIGTSVSDSEVYCVADGQAFRLTGHAPFDIVFEYGSAGVAGGHPAAMHLGPRLQAMLAESVGMLGWDLNRLHEERFRAVRNALYGLPLAYACSTEPLAAGPSRDVNVRFYGPFSIFDTSTARCLFGDPLAKESGIYLWTFWVGGIERAWYVGQTQRGFQQRMSEHVACFLSGRYPVTDSEALLRGEHRLADGAMPVKWPDTLPSFLRNADTLMPKIIKLLSLLRIHVAPLPNDVNLLNRVEGAIGRCYKCHEDESVRTFFEPGVRIPARIPHDDPLRLLISCETPLEGLPTAMQA